MTSWCAAVPGRWLGWLRRPIASDAGPVERFLWGFWVLNVALFVSLVPPTLLIEDAPWPLRIAAAAGLLGACLWEAAALRARRFPLWADVLETLTVAVVAWRFPGDAGVPLIVFIITFALAGLGFRVLYGPPWKAAARTVTMLAAIVAGRVIDLPGHDVYTVLERTAPLVVPAAFITVMCGLLIRMPAVAARGRRVASRLSADLLAVESRSDVHTAILRAVLDLLADRSDVRVIVWDDTGGLHPTVAAGNRADEVLNKRDERVTFPRWLLGPIEAGESVYRESADHDELEELRQVQPFEPVGGASFAVPLHRNEFRMLTVGARNPISAIERREIEHLAKVVEMTLGSMELTEQLHSSQDALHQRTYYDPLTRLPNTGLLTQRLERALAETDRQVAVLVLNLDHFSSINDSLGPLGGDEALVAVARRLTGCVRPGDTVARLGSDQFGILLDGVDNPSEPEEIARRIVEVLSAPLTGLLGRSTDVFVRASIGLAVSGPDAPNPMDLIANADVAMHAAKNDGGAVVRVYDPAMRATVVDRVELESDLHHALERDEIVVHYQPVVSLLHGKVVGVEALARWQHPRRGLIPTDCFIAVAEESGLINQIGEWILREGCRQLREWSAAAPELASLFLNVNLSARQLAQPDLADRVGKLVGEVGIDPCRLTLELTESALVEDTEANLAKLRALKTAGVRLALDDFGTGFSSLSYLQRFPFDILKVDRAFVQGIGVDGDADAAALARAIISMGQALGLECIAEGVETPRQLDWLRHSGCDIAQGHLFAPAVPPDRLLPLLTSELSWFPRRH